LLILLLTSKPESRAQAGWRVDLFIHYIRPVVPKLCSADPKRSLTSSQGIRGYISVMADFKFAYFLIKEIMSC
jgi:hypothetical protein